MKTSIGKIDDFPLNKQKLIEIEDDYIVIVHTISGFYAIEDRCSHDDNELLGGELADHKIKCPRHGSWFDLNTGKPLGLPAVKAVKIYKIVIENDEVYLENQS